MEEDLELSSCFFLSSKRVREIGANWAVRLLALYTWNSVLRCILYSTRLVNFTLHELQ